ncbi:MAG: flagellar motor protein MotB [marine bacterium B5-7]|nr:MAG: flagellar motor protein MotB [marine bacterium B5-7]
MSDEAPVKKAEGGGSPAWVMTFADLMSLLMCFFVLLLSFSNMDLLKFKQIAGSMKNAFGVQREIKTEDMPKGTSVIAREFTPGRPTPTLINEIRQSTIDETKQTLEFTDAVTEEEEKINESIEANQDNEGSGSEAMQRQQQQQQATESIDEEAVAMLSDQDAEKVDKGDASEDSSDEAKSQENEKTITDAYKLLKTLEPEIEQGLIAIKTQGNRILLRINEKGSFPSGSSIVKGSFLPVLNKIRKSLGDIQGRIVVAGHTDNIPIKTARFRSNWELSSSRAVTVVHELLALDTLSPDRFVIEGHGDAHPMVANDTAENRSLNRRVELIIVQGEDQDEVNEISTDSNNPFASKVGGDETPELTTSVQSILDDEIAPPAQSEVDAIDLQTLKDRFELIRQGLQEQ